MLPASGTERERLLELLKKGDLVRYGNTHVSIVYSERWGESRYNGDYDIIHAYGQPRADINGDGNPNEFARKVVITPNEMLLPDLTMSLSNPTGFGRIKLWE